MEHQDGALAWSVRVGVKVQWVTEGLECWLGYMAMPGQCPHVETGFWKHPATGEGGACGVERAWVGCEGTARWKQEQPGRSSNG